MKQVFSILTLITVLYGSACKQTTSSEIGIQEDYIEKQIFIHQENWRDTIPYTIEQSLIQLENNQFKMDVTVEPNKDSYILSRYSSQDFVGKFTIELDENSFISETGALIENPESGIIYEFFSKSDQRAILEKTICTQTYSVNSSEDFSVKGQVYFVIEPKCSMEEHPFEIRNTAGNLSLIMLDKKEE